MHLPRASLVLALTLVLAAAPAAAQYGAGQSPDRPRDDREPRVHPAIRLAVSPTIDGQLDDALWAGVPAATDFVQRQPDPGAPATQRTEARIGFDDDALYVAMRMFDTRPDSIAAPLARRDASGIHSDWAYVMIDSYHDRRTAFVFAVNPRGVQKDYLVYNDSDEDISWDPVWEVATAIDPLGWTAEFRIPLSQLRFDAQNQTWGLNLQRRSARNEEWSFWSPWAPEAPGYVSNFGTLTGLAELRPSRRLELQPYASTRLTRAPANPGNPFYRPTEPGAAVGLDLKLGLTAGLTLSGTINPDFGQVEVDPAVVNLSAYESFFPERRPFFVEGADIFRFGQVRSNVNLNGREFFYSRRIGRAPQRQLDDESILHVDAPEQSTILGAAKVTGRAGPWTIGVVDALTGRADARYQTTDGERLSSPVEPLTNYALARVRRDFREGATVAGAMVTATHRDLEGDEFDGLLHSRAYFGGTDFEHRWADRAWTLSAFAAASRVEGSPEAVARTQRASARYFQRPDAEHLGYDPARTDLTGYATSVALRHTGRWDFSVRYDETSPGFEINDLGFHSRADSRAVTAFLGHRATRPAGIFRNRSAYLFGGQEWNLGGNPLLTLLGTGANATLTSLWSGGFEGNVQTANTDDRLTRGGPLARKPRSWFLNTWLETDSRRTLSFNGSVELTGNDAGGWGRGVWLGADWRPSAAIRVRVEPNVWRGHSTRQYVLATTDATHEATFGRRYVFADIDQTTVSMNTRLDWTFTPRLTLQLFAQPFVAAGEYGSFKEFRTPGRGEFDVYGGDRGTITPADGPDGVRYTVDPDGDGPASSFAFDDPDFTLRSLRGNAVLRWEYRPGSTLFFIWQQQRSEDTALGDFRFSRDVGEVFTTPGTNVFLIKATYWFGR